MSYYFMAVTTRHDAAQYQEYLRQVTPLLLANHCTPLSVNADFTVVGGEARLPDGAAEPNVVVLLEFPSKADFENWWHSDEYAGIAPLRHASSTPWVGVGVEGEVRL